MSWDRGAPTQVVQNAHQAKQEPDRGPPWFCTCGATNVSSASHCVQKGCGLLRPDERAMRLQARAIQGMGRGGGYFERGDASDRRESNDDCVVDEFGRRRSVKAKPAPAEEAPGADEGSEGAASSGAKNSLTSVPALPTKAERQKAALERLRRPKAVKDALSPPRSRVYREPSSRSRSRDRNKKMREPGFILSGGIG
mmetsp:Transcript_47456/g.140169  ORF Transcript_47456/g.140169 Transcript_47456/m.140169 type:complete len:197 (-) Transcript_47456:164-754(-)